MGPLSELGGVEAVRKHPLMPRDETGQPLPITLSEINSLMEYLSGARQGSGVRGNASKPGDTDKLARNAQGHPAVLKALEPQSELLPGFSSMSTPW